MTSPRPLTLEFEQFANELLYEVLSHLRIEDIIRSRRVCKRLQEATHQRVVWSGAYQNSKLLIPEGPTSTQTAKDLEDILVEAAKIRRKWSTVSEAQAVSRKSLEVPSSYIYDVAMISGHYLVVATQTEISWYDLNKDGKEQLGAPIAIYQKENLISAGMQLLSVQVNANREGKDIAYVAFASNRCIKVLKVRLPPSTASIENAAEFPQLNYFPVRFVLENDFLLVIKEFQSDEDPIDLFHIPTKRKYLVPMHGRVHNLSDLNYVNYMITSTHLIMTFPITHEGKSEVELFKLPISHTASSSVSRVAISHKAVYPGVIWKATSIFESRTPDSLQSPEVRIGILASCYEEYNHRGVGGKTSLRYFDIIVSPIGSVEFLGHSTSGVHSIEPQTTNVYATSCSTACLAITQTYTSHGQILMMHTITPGIGAAEGNIVSNHFTLPRLPSRTRRRDGMTLISFDGFRGRILFDVQGSAQPRIDVWSMI
ncbi:hypothetical protein BDZ94DRAFT_1308546 [Collybia nuda]|uniref:F-box domain-containing protein n=1 Tax=Collybia nuda TaxID=64659 RepID=A0A9P5Y9A3_9AGAR|nr:hypothetical protein BDZ94DRAFT_1308546 [Collybia nuda]